jgi:hypothetical protein
MAPKPFKPPRPITQSSSTTTKSNNAAPAAAKPRAKPITKGKGKAITVLSDSEDGADDIDMLADTTNMFPSLSEDDDDDELDTLDAVPVVRLEPPVIPQKLLARLLHEHFVQADTKITKEAMEGLMKYIEIFTKEAIARACFAKDEGGNGRGASDFLEVCTRVVQIERTHSIDTIQVDDLERLAPQLLLDF